MKNVVIFSPNRFSLYTICVTELLRRNDINVQAIVVRKLFNPERFLFEFNRDGFRLIKKIWKKLFLRQGAYKKSKGETIVDLMKSENISFSKVEDFRANFGIPVLYCADLNDAAVTGMLSEHKPDMIVFTGGGIIRKEILANAGAGVLNCHMGVLPQYRGMDVVEWPVLGSDFDQIGLTVHFMDKGIDTGDILHIEKMRPEPYETIKQLRDRFEPQMCRQIVKTCLDYLHGRVERINQAQEDGKQYFIMHPRLMKIAEDKMQQRAVK